MSTLIYFDRKNNEEKINLKKIKKMTNENKTNLLRSNQDTNCLFQTIKK